MVGYGAVNVALGGFGSLPRGCEGRRQPGVRRERRHGSEERDAIRSLVDGQDSVEEKKLVCRLFRQVLGGVAAANLDRRIEYRGWTADNNLRHSSL